MSKNDYFFKSLYHDLESFKTCFKGLYFRIKILLLYNSYSNNIKGYKRTDVNKSLL